MKMKISYLPACCLLLAAQLSMAQQSTLGGPIAGYVFDSSARVLRPVRGIPGASLLGDPVNFGFDLAAAYVSPGQDSAMVVGADDSLHMFRLNAGTATEVSLGGVSGVPQTVVFSPSGSAAALFANGHVRILTGLPAAPTLVATVSIADSGHAAAPVRKAGMAFGTPASGTGLAVSDDGAYLLGISGSSVKILGVRGDNRTLAPAQADSLVAFAPGGHDAAIMDSVGGLLLIRDAAGTGSPQVLAPPDDGLAGPAGLAFSVDKQTLYVASAKAQSVAAFNLAGGSRTAVGCNCTPSTLIPMGSVFRLNDVSPSPMWLLDTGASTPRTVFVPARAE